VRRAATWPSGRYTSVFPAIASAGDLELDRMLRLLLKRCRLAVYPVAVAYVSDAQLHQIASAQLAIYPEIKQASSRRRLCI
jgi:hypothetical protein